MAVRLKFSGSQTEVVPFNGRQTEVQWQSDRSSVAVRLTFSGSQTKVFQRGSAAPSHLRSQIVQSGFCPRPLQKKRCTRAVEGAVQDQVIGDWGSMWQYFKWRGGKGEGAGEKKEERLERVSN